MSKHSKQTVSQRVHSTNRQTKKAEPQQSPANPPAIRKPFLQWLIRFFSIRSIFVTIILALGIYTGMTEIKCYKWVWENYLKGNWELIQKHPKTTIDERLKMKLGFDYGFLSFINENTPEDAVILFPLPEYITEKSGTTQLTGNICSKMWVTHFIYPRRVVYKSEAESNPLYKDITHVAICAGHGYEDTDYPGEQTVQFTVLPKNMNNNK
jgi:hypothetical protein